MVGWYDCRPFVLASVYSLMQPATHRGSGQVNALILSSSRGSDIRNSSGRLRQTVLDLCSMRRSSIIYLCRRGADSDVRQGER
jgi:hypothetical protein